MKIFHKNVLFFYLLVGIIAFDQLPNTFFQQDEWAIFGKYLYWDKIALPWVNRLFFYESVSHLIPFTTVFYYFQFKFFGLWFAPYAMASIILHIINALLVTKVVLQLKGSKVIAFLSGLLFLINPTTTQAVTWIATAPGTILSVMFTLLSIVFMLQHKLMLSLLALVAALGFKESSVFLFLFLPVLSIISRREVKRRFDHAVIAVIFVGLIYFGVRLFFSIVGPKAPVSIEYFSQPTLPVYIYRFLTNPIKVFSQTIVPQEIIIFISNGIMKLAYPHLTSGDVPDPYIAQSVGSDIVSYGISAIILGIIFLILRKKSILSVAIIFIAMSVLPLILIPGPAGYISLFDGRHLYMTSVGVGIVLAILAVTIVEASSRLRWIAVSIVAAYFLYGIGYIRMTLTNQVTVAETRKGILNTITKKYPKLPKKAIIITESDKAYYGLPPGETVLPFQSGFGNTLLVWYDMNGDKFPACFFKQNFLYIITEQGYKECEGRGFGYFREMENLIKVQKEYQIPVDNIIRFKYISSRQVFLPISF